jgi:hypothetical protein
MIITLISLVAIGAGFHFALMRTISEYEYSRIREDWTQFELNKNNRYN